MDLKDRVWESVWDSVWDSVRVSVWNSIAVSTNSKLKEYEGYEG